MDANHSIRNKLALVRDLGDTPDDRLVKAFRLKEFARCPNCDNKSIKSWDESIRFIKVIECTSCHIKAKIGLNDIVNNQEGYYIDDTFALLAVDRMKNEH